MSDLNKDFEQVAEQINAKLQEATVALKEANRLRTEAGLPALIFTNYVSEDIHYHNEYSETKLSKDEISDKVEELENKLKLINVSALESELCHAGWSTSSSYC